MKNEKLFRVKREILDEMIWGGKTLELRAGEPFELNGRVVFASFNRELKAEITQIDTFRDFRELLDSIDAQKLRQVAPGLSKDGFSMAVTGMYNHEALSGTMSLAKFRVRNIRHQI